MNRLPEERKLDINESQKKLFSKSFLNTKRDTDWNDSNKRKKHANSRRSEVSKKSGCFFFVFFNNFII